MKKTITLIFLFASLLINSQTGVNKPGWGFAGNGITSGSFLGTINAQDLIFKSNSNTLLTLGQNSIALFTSTVSATQFNVTGSSGAGTMYFPRQLANPSTTLSTGFRIFADVAAAFSWRVDNGTDNYVRKFSGALTANRGYTLPDATGTLVLTSDLAANDWQLIGNSATIATNFIGTTSANDFIIKANSTEGVRLTSTNVFSLSSKTNFVGCTAGSASMFLPAGTQPTLAIAGEVYRSGNRGWTFENDQNNFGISIRNHSKYATMYMDSNTVNPNFQINTAGGANLGIFAGTTSVITIGTNGNIGLAGATYSPQARVMFSASNSTYAAIGTATAVALTGTNVLKGNIEFVNDNILYTIPTGTVQKNFALWDILGTSGRVPYVTTNGRLLDNANFTWSIASGLTTPSITASGVVTTTMINSTGALVLNAPTGNPVDIKVNSATVLDIITSGATITGNITLPNAGNRLIIKSGANSCVGTVTLVAGAAAVTNTNITANSIILPIGKGVINIGTLSYSVTAGASFTITSSSPSDTRTVGYFIIEPN